MSGYRVFITGGATGLGRALAARYGRDGWQVCVGDIDETGAAKTIDGVLRGGGRGHALRCDVTREEDLQAAADWMQRSWGGVDLVINNAGVAVAGGIADVSMADWQWIVDINLLGVVRGCKVFTPLLRHQGRGHLVNIASAAGLIHAPLMAPYNATKAAVVALSETLRTELADDGITVSVACPSFFRSGIIESSRASDNRVHDLASRLVGSARLGPEEIADRIHRGVERGDFYIITHPEIRLSWLFKRYAPGWLYATTVRRIARRVTGRQRRAEAAAGGNGLHVESTLSTK